jgi:hypothetical protein
LVVLASTAGESYLKHVTDGLSVALRLIGAWISERRIGARRDATFPARQYSVNGERPPAKFRPGASEPKRIIG